jgi:hypothetical protein
MTDKRYLTKEELFIEQAPSFNFELDADELLEKALKLGFVRKVEEDKYEVNEDYR